MFSPFFDVDREVWMMLRQKKEADRTKAGLSLFMNSSIDRTDCILVSDQALHLCKKTRKYFVILLFHYLSTGKSKNGGNNGLYVGHGHRSHEN